MGWWFGRKSAPADARPFVPAWLTNVGEEEGFWNATPAELELALRAPGDDSQAVNRATVEQLKRRFPDEGLNHG